MSAELASGARRGSLDSSDHAQLDDLVVDTTMLDAQQVAAEIHHAAGWSTFTLGDIAA